jgi:hypothetical protein
VKKSSFLFLAVLIFTTPARGAPPDQIRKINTAAAQKSFFLPGWGQWYKGYAAKGAILGAVEIGSIALAYTSYQQAKDAERDFRKGKASYSEHTRMVDQANFFVVAAALVWGYSLVDAYVGDPAPHFVVSMNDEKPIFLSYRFSF